MNVGSSWGDVQKNVEAVTKQLEDAGQKLSLSLHISRPETRDEEGLPLTEIREELDEEGNVICGWPFSYYLHMILLMRSIAGVAISSTDTAPRVADALRKAGVTDSPDTSKRKPLVSKPARPEKQVQETDMFADDHIANPDSKTPEASTPEEMLGKIENTPILTDVVSSDTSKKDAAPLRRKKSVSFAEGTKTEDSNVVRKRLPNPLFAKARGPPAIATADTIHDVQRKPPQEQLTALLNAEANIMRAASNDDSDAPITSPIIPEDESPEDAALRRQMLQYNMHEVGAVVAEIDLDDDESTPPYSEDEEDEYNYDDSSVEEEEDEHGRSTNIVFSDEYIKQMKALEDRLNSPMIQTVDPNANLDLLSQSIEESPKSSPANPERDSGTVSKNPPSKGVRFAATLDIQEAPTTQDKSTQSIVPFETSDDPDSSISAPTKPKISRFKNARKTQPVGNEIVERPLGDAPLLSGPKPILTTNSENGTPNVAMGPPDRPHADTIIERPFPSHSTASPKEPDEFDPGLLQHQLKSEYHRHRNRMIYRQGGFLPTEEDDEVEVLGDEHDHEEGRKMSRFKAARLGR